MNRSFLNRFIPPAELALPIAAGLLLLTLWLAAPVSIIAQDDGPQPAENTEAADSGDESGEEDTASGDKPQSISLWDLFFVKGGLLMLPIYAMSAMVVFFTIERGLALTRRKVVPNDLISGLGNLGTTHGGFDPRKAYRLCQEHPSSASSVIRAMLLKVGRPHSEVEHAVAEASEREAARLYSNVRFIALAAAVTPLLGLLGTVWGMIDAFFKTTIIEDSQNKTNFLAEGIYVALVTTFGGLAVAIPAAIVAHFYEGRIQTLFREIEEVMLSLLPQIERYEGRLRVSRQQLDGAGETAAEPSDAELVAKSD